MSPLLDDDDDDCLSGILGCGNKVGTDLTHASNCGPSISHNDTYVSNFEDEEEEAAALPPFVAPLLPPLEEDATFAADDEDATLLGLLRPSLLVTMGDDDTVADIVCLERRLSRPV